MTASALADALPADPILERRALVQATARRSLGRRKALSAIMLGGCGLAFVIASTVLVWIVYLLVSKGLQWMSVAFFTQDPQSPTVFQPNNLGGIRNAIVGSLVIDGLAVAIAVPIGVLAGFLMAESENAFANAVRTTTEVMTGLPSILFGIFIYEFMILKYHYHFSGMLGSFALAILMVPVIMKASEIAFRAVPHSLKEAGLSLGLSKGKVGSRIVAPAAVPGLLTAVLLATSRAVGETAPLLWVIGNTYITSWSLSKEQSAVPLSSIYNYFLNGTPQQQAFAWGSALFLVAVVLLLNLGSRLLAAFIQRERR